MCQRFDVTRNLKNFAKFLGKQGSHRWLLPPLTPHTAQERTQNLGRQYHQHSFAVGPRLVHGTGKKHYIRILVAFRLYLVKNIQILTN
jgi:hypothetical protein